MWPRIPHPSALIPLLALACAQPQPTAHAVHRVVSLAPNITEIIFAIGAGERVAGRDDFSDFPAAAKRLPRVGGVQPNLEQIAALHPDLVVANASNMHPNLVRALGALQIPLLVIRCERLQDIPTAMTRIGARLGVDPRNAVASFQQRLQAQRRQRAQSPRVLFVVWTNPLYIPGRQTFIDDLFALTGATNAAEVNGWPQYSLESFVARRPDL